MAEKWIDTINITGAPYGNLYMEEERVKTYTHWPLDTQGFTMTMALAKSGFFYTGKADYVMCSICDIEVNDWARDDMVHERHALESPNCPLVLEEECKNVSLTIKERNAIRAELEMRSLRNSDAEAARTIGDYRIEGAWPPYNPHFEEFDRRKSSFKDWFPWKQRIDEFAAAGFHYRDVNVSDSVECFHCTGVLENFEPTDDIWREHARWYPGCFFVRKHRGTDFIKRAREGMTRQDLDTWETLRERYREGDIDFLDDPNEFRISDFDGYKRCKAKGYETYNIRRAYEANGNEEFRDFNVLDNIVRNLENGITGPLENLRDSRAENRHNGAVPAAANRYG